MKLVPAFTASGNAARYHRPDSLTRDGTKTIRVVVDLVHQRAVLVHRMALAVQRIINATTTPRKD